MSRLLMAMSALFVMTSALTAYGDTYVQWTDATLGSLTSATVKSAPDGTTPDSRTTIGLGEQVVVKFDWRTWSDWDCNTTTWEPEFDTIGDRVWACSTGGTIDPCGVTAVNSTTLTAGYDPDICVVGVDVYDSETKHNDPSVHRSMTFTIIAPDGEMTAFDSWLDSTVGCFKQTLTPTSVCFGNISVYEQDGQNGGNDGCYFTGSLVPVGDHVSGGYWGVAYTNQWTPDRVGWSHTQVDYYRTYRPSTPKVPCSRLLDQDMLVFEGQQPTYTSNTLGNTIGATTVSATRDGEIAFANY